MEGTGIWRTCVSTRRRKYIEEKEGGGEGGRSTRARQREYVYIPARCYHLFVYGHTCAHTHTHTHIYIYIYARVHVHTHTNADAAVATLHKLFSPAKNMFPHHHHPAPGKKISAYRDAVLSALCRRTDRRTDVCAVTRPGRVYADMRESSFVMAWLSVLHTDIHHRHHKMSPPFHVVEFCVAQHRILESTRPSFESLSVVQEERPHKSK